jgi:hypothetical protein
VDFGAPPVGCAQALQASASRGDALEPGRGSTAARSNLGRADADQLFSSGSFCRIVLAPFSMPHMGKTEGVPCECPGISVR